MVPARLQPGCQLPLETGKWNPELEPHSKCPRCGKDLLDPALVEQLKQEVLSEQEEEMEEEEHLPVSAEQPKPGGAKACTVWGILLLVFVLVFGALLLTEIEKTPLAITVVNATTCLFTAAAGVALLRCKPAERERVGRPKLVVREQRWLPVVGSILAILGLALLFASFALSSAPPAPLGEVALPSVLGLFFVGLSVWMLLARKNRTLRIYDSYLEYTTSFGRTRDIPLSQIVSVRVTANRSMLVPVLLLFAAGCLIPLSLYLFTDLKMTHAIYLTAVSTLPLVLYCIVFAPVLLVGELTAQATKEWNSMHVRFPITLVLILGLLISAQVYYFWESRMLSVVDFGRFFLLDLVVTMTLILLFLIMLYWTRTPKRLRKGDFGAMILSLIMLGFVMTYGGSLAISGPAEHYPAEVVERQEPASEEDEEEAWKLTVRLDDGKTAVLNVSQRLYQLEEAGADLVVCQKKNHQKQVQTMLTKVQTYSRIPLLLTCDEEGGRVSRLMETIGTTKVGPMLDYCDKGIPKATENAAVIGRDLKNCGFNLDLAPVADVWSNPANTVIGDRAYSKDFAQAAKLVAGAVEGFHQSGVGCTLKHFPGHGDTAADTHYGSATVTKTLEELRRKELRPFQAGIEAGARLVTEVLREEMGFQGVVMTDGLRMKAMTDHYSSGEIAVKALSAGVDLLLCPEDPEAATTALVEAVQQGTISQERLDESVLRVLTLKEKLGLLGEVSESEPPEKVPAAA